MPLPSYGVLPQVRMFPGSFCRLTRCVLPRLKPVVYTHRPALHTRPPVQAFSQRPQLLLSLCRSVHTHVPMLVPEHWVVPGGHLHRLLRQTAFALQKGGVHNRPQPPQLCMSEAVSMHVPVMGTLGQNMTVGGNELHVHWEAVQVPNPQPRPHDPQWRASELRSAHDDPQSVYPDEHVHPKFCPNELAPARVTERLGGAIA
jgi:hypothetical protein